MMFITSLYNIGFRKKIKYKGIISPVSGGIPIFDRKAKAKHTTLKKYNKLLFVKYICI